MSSSYSANQYDSAFRSRRLQNWCEAKHFKEKPTAQRGHTTFIANDKGHLLPGVAKRGSAWPDFKGTWDLPTRIPTHRINPTSRSVDGLNRLKSWGLDPRHGGKSQPHGGIKSSDKLQDDGEQSNGDVRQDGAAPFSAAEAQPASQYLPVTGGEPTANQHQDLQAAVVESVNQPAEEKQAIQATGTDRPLSQCSAAEEKPAAGEGTNSKSSTGKGRPASNVAEKVANQRVPPTTKQRQKDAKQDK